jgi:triacylglycerol esterase/lipase EstA (alpha/beta hydrolase family)
MANYFPMILVHGLFGWGPTELAEFPYWGSGASVPSPLPRYLAQVGPISSLHDRACELAYQIRGGRVDYGKQHSSEAGHARYGHGYPARTAFHPDWSAKKPVHLVGHSMGGPTAFVLQQLLADDFFGWGSSADWVASMSSISGVLNGSTATYYFGCNQTTGLLDERAAANFLGHAIEQFVRATGGVFDRVYDFMLDQWGIPRQPDENLAGYVARIAASDMFVGRDNGAYSLTIQSLLTENARCATHPSTHYFAYTTCQTFKALLSPHYWPEPDMNPFMLPSSFYIGHTQFAMPFYKGFRSRDWWPNDGLVSVFSQQYPRIAGDHRVHGTIGNRKSFDPGGWYYQNIDDVDHIDIVALPQLNQIGWQKRFYMALFARLAAL